MLCMDPNPLAYLFCLSFLPIYKNLLVQYDSKWSDSLNPFPAENLGGCVIEEPLEAIQLVSAHPEGGEMAGGMCGQAAGMSA